ncbi:MAG TPA: TonB-dependent receptor, partial [Phenylobacterium sp.]|nr:TonB-dependent receptor [Phenylobacterium sp.]
DLNILAPVVPRAACALTGPGAVPCRRQAFSRDIDKSIAAYGQGSYEIMPGTKLTLGARYTIEKRSIEGLVLVNGVRDPNRDGDDSQKFKEVTWRAALDHQFTQNVMGYASVSRGFNAGFFNQSSTNGFANRTQNPAVAPEFLTAYEVGFKTDLLDRRLRLNGSAFLYKYKGLQQQVYDQGAVVTINAGAAEIKGVDFEVVARPVPSLTLSLTGTYLDAEFQRYPLAPNYVLQGPGDPQPGAITAGITLPNGTIVVPGSVDAAGKKIVNTPEWSYTAAASHVLSTSMGDFTTSANLNYRGKTFNDPQNRFKLPERYLLNATERWTSPDGHYFVSVWAKNLLNKRYDYAVNILTPAGLIGNGAPPRTYGVTAGVEF